MNRQRIVSIRRVVGWYIGEFAEFVTGDERRNGRRKYPWEFWKR